MAKKSEHGCMVFNSAMCFCHSDCGRGSDGFNLSFHDGVVHCDDDVSKGR